MARKYPTSMAEVKVYINGKEQAKKDLEELRQRAKEYSDQMKIANEQRLANANDPTKFKEYNEADKNYKIAEREWKRYQKLIKETERQEVDLEEALQHLAEQDIARLKYLERALKAIQSRIKGSEDPDAVFLGQINDALQQVTDTIKQKKGEIVEFSDIMDDLTNIDDTSLAKAEQRLKSLLAATDKDDIERIKQLSSELKKVQDEGKRRVKVEAVAVQQQVADGTYKGTIEETQRAIKLQEEYKKSLKTTDSKSIKEVEKTIEGLNKKLDAYQKKQTASVLKNLDDSSYAQIQAAIEHAKKLQQAAKPGSSAWNNYGKQIANATLYLEKWNDQQKRTKMVEMSKMDLGKMSDDDLKTALRYWDGMVNGIGRTNVAMKQYKEIYDRLQAENTKRGEKLISKVVDQNDLGGNINQMQQRLQILEDFRKTIDSTKPDAYLRVDAAIDKLKQGIKETQANFMSFDDALKKAQQVADGTFDGTLEDIEKIQKALKEGMTSELNIVDDADLQKMKEAQRLMEETAKKQQELARIRLEEQAKLTQEQVEKGTYKGTIEETEKAIAIQKQYQKTLDTTDAAGLKKVEDTIEALQQKLKQAQSELLSYKDAMSEADKISKGTWKGTIEELDKIKKSLEYYKKNKLKIGADDKDLKKVNEALRDIDKTAKGTAMSMADIEKLLEDLDHASMEQLQNAAKNLQDMLQNTARSSDPKSDYAKTAAKLREVNLELKKAKKEWEGQENVIARTAKRLMAYVAVYGGFNAIVDKMKEVVSLNLQLSDSMADVQKTTGLTGIELQELGRGLEKIDTRTATTELYQLAAAAGQIGLKTQEDVLGFAKAANTISVALNELGAEGSASLMKIATLTGEVERYGTEQALTRVGSAINELTANSAATAGPIADFISRVGGIASASKIAISEMAALGAAADASGQSIEIAGTSMNKFISALTSNTENIAYAANISVSELQGLIKQGETMQAVIRVLEAMQSMTDRGAINELMKELGSEGARMNQYVSSMVANLDLLKRQLNISREAFQENVSVLNEYNVKQESAMGILQRMKNAFLDTFVNSRMTAILKDVLEVIAAIPGFIAKIPGALLTIKIIIAQILLFKLPFLLHSLMLQLSGLYRLLSGPVASAFNVFHAQVLLTQKNALAAGKSISYLSAAFRTLGSIIAKHPILTFLSAVTAGITIWMHYRDQVDEVTKATLELSQKHNRQLEELASLRAAIESVNTSYATRAAAMREINSLYGKYLGFELSELDNYGKKARALDYINAKLKENQALELKNERQSVIREGFKESSEFALSTVEENLTKDPNITRARWTEVLTVMNEAIKDGARTTHAVIEELDKYFETDIKRNVGLRESVNSAQLKTYIEQYAKFLDDMKAEDDSYNNAQTVNRQKTYERQVALFEEQQKIVENLRNDETKRTEAEQKIHLQKLQKEQKDLLAISESLFESAKEQDFSKIGESLGKDQLFDVEAIRKNVSEATAVRAEGMNKLIEQREEIRKLQLGVNDEVKNLESQLTAAQSKENNEEEVKNLTATLEEKKALRDKYGKDIFDIDSKWQDDYQAMQTKNASETKIKWMETTDAIKEAIKEVQMAIDGDPFGKLLNMKSWKGFEEIINPTALKDTNAASIVGVYKKLREDYLKMSGDLEGLNKMFEFKVPMTSLDQAQEQIFSWAEQLRNELRRRGLTTTGMMIAPDAKSQVDNALNKLKTHFIKRQSDIRDSFINGTISSVEMNRKIEENDQELLRARVELQKRLMGQESYFKQALYPELNDVDIQRITAAIGVADSEVRATLEEALAEDANTLKEGAIAARQKIEAELLAIDPFRGLDQNLQSTLDEMQLMYSDFEKKQADTLSESSEKFIRDSAGKIMGLDKETQRDRLEFLMEMSKMSYTVDAAGLREMMKSHKDYYNWIANLDDQELHLMLIKLQKFYDDALIAQENYGRRIRKSLEASYNQQGKKLGELGKEEWMLEGMIDKRNALIKETLSKSYNDLTDVDKKSLKDRIDAINLEINKQEEKVAELREKTDKESKSRKKQKEREAKDEMEASISALKAYYKEQEAVIRQNALDKKWTPEELERKLTENTIKAEKDAIELRKKLLGDPSTFDPFANDSYKGAITGTVFFGKTRDLEQQAKEIKLWGKGFRDGMRNEIAESNVEIAKEMQKVSDVIKNALLEGDMFGKFENDFATMLDELGILTSNLEDDIFKSSSETLKKIGVDFDFGLTEEDRAKRIEALTQFADQSYQINEKGLRDLMAKNTQFALWANNLTEEEMTLLLGKLRNYYDDRLDLTKKYQDKLKKEFESYYQQTGKQGEYESKKKNLEGKKTSREQFEGLGGKTDYSDIRNEITEGAKIEGSKLAEEIDFQKEKLEALKEGSQERLAVEKLIADKQLELNDILAQSQRDLTQVYMEEWNKRAEKWGEVGEMFGDFLGEQLALENQANKARARGDLETAKKIEQQQKENKQNLIKGLLNFIVDEAALWAKELALKMMFNAMSAADDQKRAVEEVSLEGKKSMLSIFLSALTGQASEAKKGLPGLITGAIVFAATMALQAMAKSAISNMFPEADTGSTNTRKLSTGMLTYAEGNYPVLGNDGKVYDAKYEGAGMKTGIYGGGAHFGIFSEKQPEMIVDGKTTQKLILNYPYIYDAITTIAKNGRLVNAMPTFATGDYPAGMKPMAPIATVEAPTGNNEQIERMSAALEQTQAVNNQLLKLLQGGIVAHLDGLETHKTQKRNERFLKRRGID